MLRIQQKKQVGFWRRLFFGSGALNHPKKQAGFWRRFFFGDATPNLPKENPFQKQETVISGRRLINRDEAEEIADIEPTDAGLSFGGIRVGSETNIIICGQVRSGKTTLLRQMMAKALLQVAKKGSDARAVIYDATGDFVPFVYGVMGDDATVIIFDPEDERGFSWDVSADITTPAQAQNLAEILIPKEDGDEPFFIGGAQSLTKAVLESFLLRTAEAKENGEKFSWTLRDLFNALATKESAVSVLRGFATETKDFEHEIKLYLERSNDDILSTIASKSSRARLVAAMWDERPKVSIKDFVENTDGRVIIITSSNESSAVVKELNRLFIERLSQTLLDTRSLTNKRTHIFLDEFTEIGKLDAIKRLLKLGLKKGVRVYLCYQNFEDVKETYGGNQASVILSESGTIAFLRQTGDSAKAAAEFIGKQIITITNSSTGASGNGEGMSFQTGKQETQVERWTVEPEAFSNRLLLAGKKNGVGGFFMSPSVGDVWSHRFHWKELERYATATSDNSAHEPKKPRAGIGYQFLRPWKPAERLKFGIKLEIPAKEEEQQAQQTASAAVDGKPKGFDIGEYTARLKESRIDDRPASELNVFEKVQQGRGEIDIDEMEKALKEVGIRYHE